MNILEKEIEDVVLESLQHNYKEIYKKGLYVNSYAKYIRQPNLGNYGIPDIVGCTITRGPYNYKYINVNIIELKKEKINNAALVQICRYATGIEFLIKSLNIKNYSLIFELTLIGKDIDDSGDFVFILNQIHNLTAYTFGISLTHGIEFSQCTGHSYTHPKFPKNELSSTDIKEMFSSEGVGSF